MLDYRNPRPGWIDNRGGNIQAIIFDQTFESDKYSKRICFRSFYTMVITSKAQVVVCCSDMYWDVIWGDVRTERLEAIWDGEKN